MKLKKFKLHFPWNFWKSSYHIEIVYVKIVPKFTRGIILSQWAGNERMSPVPDVNVCSPTGGLHSSSKFVKFVSKQDWKHTGETITWLIWWLNEKAALMSTRCGGVERKLFNLRSYEGPGMWGAIWVLQNLIWSKGSFCQNLSETKPSMEYIICFSSYFSLLPHKIFNLKLL